jgi:AcrR family transcriptional regulator
LGAATRVFARRGYRDASVEEIAEEAGFSYGAVYSNFEGKADLFLAVFEDYMAQRARELADARHPDGPLPERARALADQWMERFADDRESFLLQLEFIAYAGRDPELGRRFAERSVALRLAIERYLAEDGAETPELVGLPPDELALVLRALGIGLAVEALNDPSVRPGLYGDFVELLFSVVEQRRAPAPHASTGAAR